MFSKCMKKCICLFFILICGVGTIIFAEAATAVANIQTLYCASQTDYWLSGTGSITSNPLIRPYSYTFSGANILAIPNPGYCFGTGSSYNNIAEHKMYVQTTYSSSGNTTAKKINAGVYYSSSSQTTFSTAPNIQKSSASASL